MDELDTYMKRYNMLSMKPNKFFFFFEVLDREYFKRRKFWE